MNKEASNQDANDVAWKIEQLSHFYRGVLLESIIKVETQMETIICRYFTGDNIEKSKQLAHALISTEMFSFNTKKNLIFFILKQYPDLYKKNKKLEVKLKKIIALRNIIAHRKLDKSENAIKNFDGNTINLDSWQTEESKIETKKFLLNAKIFHEEINKLDEASEILLSLAFSVVYD